MTPSLRLAAVRGVTVGRLTVGECTSQTGSSWSMTAASCLAERHSCMVITSS